MTVPVENLVSRLHAKRSGKGWLARCPAHDDRKPSLSIDEGADGRVLLKCHAGCGANDVLAALGMTARDLFPVKYAQSSGNGGIANLAPVFDWRWCLNALTDTHLEHLAKWRGYSIKFCSWLRQNRLVGFYDNCLGFPVHNRAGKVVAAHYRLEDGSWRYHPGAKVRPLVIDELIAGDPVHAFESYWDAFGFMDVSRERSGVIITRGASNGALVADLIPPKSTVYVWTQNDAAGEKWQKVICANTKATVKRAKIPAPHKDLNDWTQAGATADDLLEALVHAEVVHEPEMSWDDALAASEVTSSELHDLKLTPRRKLLGDWFCEGDLGFIFAFRGTGKTWLALAIAQALATGGKLGEWQAHECVKVLYIDSEMPPDLMRQRCDGLGNSPNLSLVNHAILFDRTSKVLNIANREIQDAITRRCVNTGVKVLFIDNLSTAASGIKENEADSWEQVNPWLLDLRRRKIAVVIVHHAGRSGEMRGTSKREDNVFWIIALDDTKKNVDDNRGARFISHFTKPSRNTQEKVAAYEWHFVTDNATGQVSVSHQLAQTMDVFLGLIEDGVTECSEIAEEMKTSKASVSRIAKLAMKSGKIVKVNREYMLAEGEKQKK
jgi:AAA domain